MAKWGSCDFEELKKLQQNVAKLQKTDMDKFCRSCVKELAARLLALVIPETPVGRKPTLKMLGGEGAKKTYKVKGASGKSKTMLSREGAILDKYWSGYMGGTLRRGWTAKTEADAQGGGAVNAAAYAEGIAVIKSGDTYQIEIVNPVRYASYVEYGHRQTPGRYVPAIGKRLVQGWAKGKYMLTISEEKLRTMTPAILERNLREVLREVFDV